MTLDELVESLRSRIDRGRRRIVTGLAGPPGAGKSTVADRLAAELGAVVAPMDGFHLPNETLDQLGRRGRKGAPDTFDADGFVRAVSAVRSGRSNVAWPTFDRDLDEPVPAGMVIPAESVLVVVEGNYLLLGEEPWSQLHSLLDPIVYLDLADDVRRGRLVDRHVRFGRAPADAERFVRESDEVNAALVASGRARADLVVNLD